MARLELFLNLSRKFRVDPRMKATISSVTKGELPLILAKKICHKEALSQQLVLTTGTEY